MFILNGGKKLDVNPTDCLFKLQSINVRIQKTRFSAQTYCCAVGLPCPMMPLGQPMSLQILGTIMHRHQKSHRRGTPTPQEFIPTPSRPVATLMTTGRRMEAISMSLKQVCSLTQFYSVDFSQSRIGVEKLCFQPSQNQGFRQLFLTVAWDLRT